MSLKEKFISLKKASEKEIHFGNEVFSKLVFPVVIAEILTMAGCIAIAWENTRVSKYPLPFHVPVTSSKLRSIVDVFPLVVEATLTLSQSLSASVTSNLSGFAGFIARHGF